MRSAPDERRAARTAGPARAPVDAWPRALIGSMPAVRRIAARWRGLTGDAPRGTTMIGVSGGADSVALALALRCATDRLAIGHVVHELRPRAEELADRDLVRALARRLGVAFFEDEIAPPKKGNMEAAARRLRYAALAAMAERAGAVFLATAHHADDQLESVLLALARGAGPGGLSGAAARRGLTARVALIRPMLRATRAEGRAICERAGAAWSEDWTNQDARRARARVRQEIAPRMEALRPGAAGRAARSAELLRDAAGLVQDRVHEVFGEGRSWRRDALRRQRAIVIGAGLRAALARAGAGRDRLTSRVIDPMVRAIKDGSTDPREFAFGEGLGALRVRITAREVTVSGAGA